MKRCPITYEEIHENDAYSLRGLRLLSPKLMQLQPLKLSADSQREQALRMAEKMSIQGVQPKLSARLKIKAGCFDIVDHNGNYILKPQSKDYPELPENEAITMTMAEQCGIEVPIHGLVYSKDSMTYFIRRFDREGNNKKLAVEDCAQLLGLSRDTKYNSSMEKIIDAITRYCHYPKIEFVKLFKRIVFNFLIGNEDMHLKNFSLITRKGIIQLSPAYDLLNTSIAIGNYKEELALPLNGKKNNLRKGDIFHYLAVERLNLPAAIIQEELMLFQSILPQWHELIRRSFLSKPMQDKYRVLLDERSQRLEL